MDKKRLKESTGDPAGIFGVADKFLWALLGEYKIKFVIF